ncbi:MFS transporter [Weissella cibaria]|uniref:MFS transporter n=1 Tax=Weissella cibaria TaxID=137591 RepID=UPI00143F6876|nr:MFS transporter [Weissella cibaria]NKN29633.1 MFS transporter [Weissella cibaria]NKN78531.1 MFS transporter [Weissella cibaria]NKN96452.1 MFS transporter [Weissella cibaria]NKN98808.1 MFS transporter [Weissella cibaria]
MFQALFLKNQQFRTIAVSRAFQAFGATLFNYAFLVYAAELPHAKLAVSVISVVLALPSMLQFFFGAVAGRVAKRIQWILTTRLIEIAGYVVIAVVFATTTPGWLPLLIILPFLVLSDVISNVAGLVLQPLIKHLVVDEHLEAANGYMMAINNTLAMVGGVIGVSLLALVHHNFTIFALLNGGFFLLSWVNLFIGRRQLLVTDRQFSDLVKPADTRLRAMMVYIISMAGLVNLLGNAAQGLLQLSVLANKQMWHGGYGTTLALIDAGIGVGIVAGSSLFNGYLHKIKLPSLVNGVVMMMVINALAVLFLPRFGLLIVINFLLGFAMGKLNPKYGALVTRIVPEEHLTTVAGLLGTFEMIGVPLGQVVFLGIANIFSTTIAWYGILGLGVILIGYSVKMMRRTATTN